MNFYLRRGPEGKVHRAVREGSGSLEVMLTACGLSVRWDLPHSPWQRAARDPAMPETQVTCRRCAPNPPGRRNQ